MNKDYMMQGVTTAALAAVGAYFHQLAFPVALLIIVMALDYATGLIGAYIRSELSSKVGIVGILKKLGYMVAVCVAVAVDWVIEIAAEQAGVSLGVNNIFALLVTIWLILNECISILENLDEIGVPVPEFLMKIVRRLKQAAEKKGNDQSAAGGGSSEGVSRQRPDGRDQRERAPDGATVGGEGNADG